MLIYPSPLWLEPYPKKSHTILLAISHYIKSKYIPITFTDPCKIVGFISPRVWSSIIWGGWPKQRWFAPLKPRRNSLDHCIIDSMVNLAMENGHLKLEFAFPYQNGWFYFAVSFYPDSKPLTNPSAAWHSNQRLITDPPGKKTTNCDGFVGHLIRLIRAETIWPAADGPKWEVDRFSGNPLRVNKSNKSNDHNWSFIIIYYHLLSFIDLLLSSWMKL